MNNDNLAVQRYPDGQEVFIIMNNEVHGVNVSLFNQFQNTYILSFNDQLISDGNGAPFQFSENMIYPTEGDAQVVLNAQLAAAAQELLDATVVEEAGALNESGISDVGSEGNQSFISTAGEEADFNSDFNNQGGGKRRRRTIKKRSKNTKKSKKSKKSKKNKKSRRRI